MSRAELVKSTDEADALQVAATIEDGYRARGWSTPPEKPNVGIDR